MICIVRINPLIHYSTNLQNILDMSFFDGKIEKYENVLVDNFQMSNLMKYDSFFLSHCHADHMKGLDDNLFYENLKSSKHKFLYCSEITKSLLVSDSRYSHLVPFVISIETDSPTTIYNEFKNKELLVTLVPAGHCPGSVMFLFEGRFGRILYTGDFRIPKSLLPGYYHFHHVDCVKEIDCLYLDTTFFVAEAKYIPPREHSVEAIVNVVSEWFANQNSDASVKIICSSYIGYENVFVQLSEKFNIKINVSQKMYEKLEKIAGMTNCITKDCNSRIFVKYKKEKDSEMQKNSIKNHSSDILFIKLSAMWFMQHKSTKDIIFNSPKYSSCYKICYSMHASYTEIIEFIEYLKPKKIIPIVIPINSSREVVAKLLSCSLTSVHESNEENILGELKKRNEETNDPIASSNESLSFSAEISPRKKIRLSNYSSKNENTCGKSLQSKICNEFGISPKANEPSIGEKFTSDNLSQKSTDEKSESTTDSLSCKNLNNNSSGSDLNLFESDSLCKFASKDVSCEVNHQHSITDRSEASLNLSLNSTEDDCVLLEVVKSQNYTFEQTELRQSKLSPELFGSYDSDCDSSEHNFDVLRDDDDCEKDISQKPSEASTFVESFSSCGSDVIELIGPDYP